MTSDGLVIHAVVSARLLGLRLLSLDARVVLGPPEASQRPIPVIGAPLAAELVSTPAVGAAIASSERARTRDEGLATAVELLSRSNDTLRRLSANGRPA